MSRVRSEVLDGKRILVVDATDATGDEYVGVLRDGAAAVQKEAPGSVLLATVVTRARFGSGAAERVKAYSATIRPYLKAGAVVGLSPLQRVIFATVRPFLHGTVRDFPTLIEAKAWLAGLEPRSP